MYSSCMQVRCLLLSTLKRSAAASSQQGDMLRGAGAMAGLGMVAQGMGGHTAETRIGPDAKTCEAAVAAFNACTEVCIQVGSEAEHDA